MSKYCSKKELRNIIWHQDQGSQYTSYKYVNTVLETGRYRSQGKVPTDNASQESFFGRLKDTNWVNFEECSILC